ncbi:oxidoreductase [Gallaecimonas mangrovi]|uniref:oxidoreductase n=1 Tax=Gallaecimonas mangrovi TaxID=2291597 RepID=UPI000E2085BC|nr:oxidoreductase [Gallaecimonas mangrovi]
MHSTFKLGNKAVSRIGYGAMQLAGSHAFGPPKDPSNAIKVLKSAIEKGVNHIDTSDFYGPHVTNQLIKEALHPYRDDLCIVTKVGVRRDDKGAWLPASSKEDLINAVHDNLRNLGLEQLEVVNLRAMFSVSAPVEGDLEEPFTVLAELQQQGLIKHLGLSNVTRKQVDEMRRIAPIVCVQNHYNLTHRQDDSLIDFLADNGIAFVPFFPLGGFSPLQSTKLDAATKAVGATAMQVALAWLLQRSANILLIPGTSSITHLEQNLASAKLTLPPQVLEALNHL